MKKLYEYLVNGVATDGYPVTDIVNTRKDARELKNIFKRYECTDVKIVQRVYKLETEREVH